MVQDIIPGTLIALAVAFPLHSSPASSVQTGFPVVYEAAKNPSYFVETGDSLGSIATKLYKDPSYWTTLWNDNDWIEDPSVIEVGWKLNTREQKPEAIEKLKPELLQKMVHEREVEEAVVVNPTAVPSPVAATQPAIVANGSLNDVQIQFLGTCEAGMIPTRNTGNGYYGAFQFSYGTWKSMNTGFERADLAPLDVQIDAVQRLVQRSSIFTQFPACSRKMRSIGLI